MQSYPINFTPAVPGRTFQANANLFVYESGTEAAGGNTKILVKPDNEAEVVLKPGQAFRLSADQMAGNWTVHTQDPNASITGNIVIGSGEWYDANTLNTFKLDATFANNVNVTNDNAHAVPVSIVQAAQIEIANDSGNRIPVTLDPAQSLNISANVMAYNQSYASTAAAVANNAIQLLAPIANVNGAILNKFESIVNPTTNIAWAVIAKATAPANLADGDVLVSGCGSSGFQRISMDIGKDGQPKVPAGKGIWFLSTSADNATVRDALFTVL